MDAVDDPAPPPNLLATAPAALLPAPATISGPLGIGMPIARLAASLPDLALLRPPRKAVCSSPVISALPRLIALNAAGTLSIILSMRATSIQPRPYCETAPPSKPKVPNNGMLGREVGSSPFTGGFVILGLIVATNLAIEPRRPPLQRMMMSRNTSGTATKTAE